VSYLQTIIHHEVVESTNDLAKQLAVEGRVDAPFVVRATRQTRGRGRGNHSWWSDSGSLTFSIVLDPAAQGLRVEQEPTLALAAAVAVIEAIEGLVPAGAAGIRWPNDIEVGGRKLGGILPERVETARGPRLVLGIGLNVLTQLADAPREVRQMAISLTEVAASPLRPEDLDCLFRDVLGGFELTLARLAHDHLELAARWGRLDSLLGRWVRVDLGSEIVAGLGQGIDPDGALLLAGERETVRLFGGRVLREGRCETGRQGPPGH
jgi:BirA family biotin operon repressor/biotin-[acetyl-CoA-carboxylase] ligase